MQILSKIFFKKNMILSIVVFFVLLLIIISPQKYISVSFNAIEVWYKVLLPSLFPFFVFSKLLTSFGYVKNISSCFEKVSYKLYKTPPISSYVFFMSILTGYPVGSKLCSDLYKDGYLSKSDAKKCITYTSNSGPMFIIGSVGIGMLISKQAGYIILISHIIGALLNGLLYRNLKYETKQTKNIYSNKDVESSLSSCVMDSIFSILLIGGIVVVAFIFIEVLNNIGIFNPIIYIFSKLGVDENITTAIVNGFFEITKGCLSESSLNLSLSAKTILSCAIISFGGISTTMQAMAFIKDIVTYKFFIGQKITHMILSTIICAILCFIFF